MLSTVIGIGLALGAGAFLLFAGCAFELAGELMRARQPPSERTDFAPGIQPAFYRALGRGLALAALACAAAAGALR